MYAVVAWLKTVRNGMKISCYFTWHTARCCNALGTVMVILMDREGCGKTRELKDEKLIIGQ